MKKRYKLAPAFENDINDSINEALGISFDVCQMRNDIMDYINTNLKNAAKAPFPAHKYQLEELSTLLEGYYILRGNVTSRGQRFLLNINILNFETLTKKQEEFVLRYLTANCSKSTNKAAWDYVLRATLPIVNFNIPRLIHSVFMHELAHSWTSVNRPEYDENQSDKRSIEYYKMRQLYDIAVGYIGRLKNAKNKNDIEKKLLKFSQAVYISNADEIVGFTHQAYNDRKEELDIDKANELIRSSQLYKYTNALADVIEMFKNGEIEEVLYYVEKENRISIDRKGLLYLFKKRYKKCIDNLTKLTIANKTMVEQRWAMYNTMDFSKNEIFELPPFVDLPLLS